MPQSLRLQVPLLRLQRGRGRALPPGPESPPPIAMWWRNDVIYGMSMLPLLALGFDAVAITVSSAWSVAPSHFWSKAYLWRSSCRRRVAE